VCPRSLIVQLLHNGEQIGELTATGNARNFHRLGSFSRGGRRVGSAMSDGHGCMFSDFRRKRRANDVLLWHTTLKTNHPKQVL
jgi:hypothetical protein